MSDLERIALIDKLRAESAEREWLEFKGNHCAPEELGEYLSALANGACAKRRSMGYLLFGIDNDTRNIVGTSFDPYRKKARGQELLIWLNTQLKPNPGFDVHVVDHPDGRVVLFSIRPAQGQPVLFGREGFIRVGSSKTKLSNNPEALRAIFAAATDWSAEICKDASPADLDESAIAAAREQYKIKFPGKAEEVDDWSDKTFLNKAKLTIRGKVTNAALLLLGKDESTHLLSPSVAQLSWFLKDADNRDLDYEHFGPPFLTQVGKVIGKIRNLTLRAMPSGTIFPREITQYEPWVLREALHNCIAHQDYGLHGRVMVVETPEQVLFVNVGDFLPGDVETVIREDAPAPTYRNRFLAEAMVNLNMIDTQGGGIKKMYLHQKERFFPLPDYDLTRPAEVRVRIGGKILDERYCQILMANTDLNLDEVILLDKVQKQVRITKEECKVLREAGLIEGRYPNLFVAADIAKATGQASGHIRSRGLDQEFYRELLLKLIRTHGPVNRAVIDELLLEKLPEILNPKQRKAKIHNLLQDLSRKKLIRNIGGRGMSSSWVLGEEFDSSSKNRNS